MNINSILNSTRPVSLYEKEKDTRDTSFMDILAQTAKEASAQEMEHSSNAEEVQSIDAEAEEKVSVGPSYTVTDEEAEYFREKYGEDYDEETVRDLFYELAEKDIISDSDAIDATCMGFLVLVVDGVEKIGYASSRDIFAREYDEFKWDYAKDIVTWEDYIQSQRDFYEYLRNRDTLYDADGNPRPNDPVVGYDERLAGLERAAEVIKQIFGQQSSGGDI